MQIVKARYRDSAAFLAAYQTQFRSGGLFVPTRAEYGLGAQVVVAVRFPELGAPVFVRAFVAWRRLARQRSRVRAGIGVEFLPQEMRKREFLLGVARGEIVDIHHRRHRRLPVQIQVGWRVKEDRDRFSAHVEDIAEGGAFIRTTEFRPVGSSVLLEVRAPGSERSLTIEGRVAWTCHTPGEEGMGVEFRCRDRGGARLLKELVRRIETQTYAAVEQG